MASASKSTPNRFAETLYESKMETKDLAKKLKQLRTQRGMSQEYLAEESHVGLRTIQRIENNESTPMGETLKRIANTLDVEFSELIGNEAIAESTDIRTTILYLKKQLSKTSDKSEIRTFKKFIEILTQLRERNLNNEQIEVIDSFIQYLELEKIPSFKNEDYRVKLQEFKKFLKTQLRLVPNNIYTTWAASVGLAFAVGFSLQKNLELNLKIGVSSFVILIILIAMFIDLKMKRQQRSFNF